MASSTSSEEVLRAGVILYRKGNGFEFLMLRRRLESADSNQRQLWDLPKGSLDERQDDIRLVALRNVHQSTGIWPDCFRLHRDFLRMSTFSEAGKRIKETFYLAEIDSKTRSGDDIDSETLPKPDPLRYAGYQWMSGDLAKISIRTDEGRLLLGQATDFLESQEQTPCSACWPILNDVPAEVQLFNR
ncbi:hypothetical protein BOX15_Mlig010637g1 [Macrostomum lignano]|uniref:Nudix hydrolase domain-containing protein n=1 Tax=Macrostomum lignano TaxID=282301 RepID=A0A267G2W6_9PLAT|nr:hypothetical protein BOX15_Mlig010637g1 [Macrostomum lignano]